MWCRTAHAGGNAEVVRARMDRIVDRVVDAVDRARLRCIRRRRQREVGVTACLAEHCNFVVDAAPAAVGPGVIECPVAVDESEGDAAVPVAAQETVSVKEGFGEHAETVGQCCGSVMVMVQMNFDIAETTAAKGCEIVEQFGLVAFFRKEERVLRRASVRVGEFLAEAGILPDPSRHAYALSRGIGVSVIGFEVIGDAEKYVDRKIPNPRVHQAVHPGTEQARKPQVSVSRE